MNLAATQSTKSGTKRFLKTLALSAAIVFGSMTVASAALPTSQPSAAIDRAGAPLEIAPPETGYAPINATKPAAAPVRFRPTTAPAASSAGFDLTRLMVAMGIVLALIFVLRYAAGWLVPGGRTARSSRAVRVLTRASIAPRQQVVLLHVGRRVIVVGDSAGTLSSLGEITEPDEVAEIVGGTEASDIPTIGGRFGTLFGRAKQDMETTLTPEVPEVPVVTENETTPENGQIQEARTEIAGLIDRMRALSQVVRRD